GRAPRHRRGRARGGRLEPRRGPPHAGAAAHRRPREGGRVRRARGRGRRHPARRRARAQGSGRGGRVRPGHAGPEGRPRGAPSARGEAGLSAAARDDVDALAAGVLAGERRALARAITLVESTREDHARKAQDLLAHVLPKTGGAHRLGISGTPGVGKSTLIEALGLHLVERDLRVAVLAVDPSSPRSGGSLLGDKTRMERLSHDERAFIRPSPSGGELGGVARRTREAMLLCEAAGFDVVVVETVGVGQSEATVASMVDTFLLLVQAGGGDELQGVKRGILELCDVVAVTKADGDLRDAARRARLDYER